jgi:hypothetical protein
MTANKNLILYLRDNNKGRSIGTLAVFVDQGIIKDRPLLALPVNLSLLLDLPNSLAYVGFTASMGGNGRGTKSNVGNGVTQIIALETSLYL